MYRTSIAVVDASRARLFIHERTSGPEGLKENLVEMQDFVDPARRLRDSELFSEAAGSGQTGRSLHYGLDDHRDAHLDQLDAEFARAVATALVAQLQQTPSNRLILCASPRMLGELRSLIGVLRRSNLEIEEVARDLVKLTPSMLRDHLESYGLLQPRPTA